MPFTVTMPKLSPTMDEGTIVKWHKKEGEFAEPGDLLIEVATDKATVEYNALDGGWLRKILVPNGKAASVNQPIAIFTEEKDESLEGFKYEPEKEQKPSEEPERAEKEEVQPVAKGKSLQQPTFIPEPPLKKIASQPEPFQKIKASPLARKLAKDKGLDLTTVQGTGPGGRIVKDDLEKAQHAGIVTFGSQELPQIPPGTYEEEELSPIRKVIAQRLQESKSFIPHYYAQQTVLCDNLFNLREQLQQWEIKLSFNDFVVRACALALRQHPEVNSGFNSVNQTIVRFKTIDIAVAVNLEAGLITPIVRHADYKNLGQISVEIKALAKRAKEGKLEPHEYKGGSFTVSNMGMFGVTNFQAIINPPQAAILAVGGIHDAPIIKNGTIVPGKQMNLTLSADHRVIDGAQAAQFLQTVKYFIENPAGLVV